MRKYLLIFILIFSVAIICYLFLIKNYSKSSQINSTNASTSEHQITAESDWTAGILDNIDYATAGSVKISDKSYSAIDLWPIYEADHDRLYAEINATDAYKVLDGDPDTHWELPPVMPPSPQTWQFDLGSTYGTSKIEYMASIPFNKLYLSEDGVDWGTDLNAGYTFDIGRNVWILEFGATSFRYVKVEATQSGIPTENVSELYIFSTANAIHTSAATQIDGSEGGTKNFIEWETFTPTYSEPANTNVKFRFRTSADASNWTSWTDYQTPASGGAFDISGLVDSASGANKYLQVETTLENTDGSSTPTVDSYSTGYHTNLAPSTPTNLTAVVGE